MDSIEAVFYINLAYRIDRKQHIERELEKAGFTNNMIYRIEAIEDVNGNLGCSKSHLLALKTAMNKNFNRFLIVEDDFEMCVTPEIFRQSITHALQDLDFDVVMLAHNTQKCIPFKNGLVKIISSQTRSGYLVNSNFAETLMNNFQESVDLMIKFGRSNIEAFGDQHWKKIQENSKWYAFEPRIAIQKAGYSDNEKRFVN